MNEMIRIMEQKKKLTLVVLCVLISASIVQYHKQNANATSVTQTQIE